MTPNHILDAGQAQLYSPGGEGGWWAGQAIRRGEALLHVPERLLITPEAALRHSSVAALLNHAALPAWSVLAALLAELKIGQTGPETTWGPLHQCSAIAERMRPWSGQQLRCVSGSANDVCSSEQLVRLTGGNQETAQDALPCTTVKTSASKPQHLHASEPWQGLSVCTAAAGCYAAGNLSAEGSRGHHFCSRRFLGGAPASTDRRLRPGPHSQRPA